MFSVRYLSWRVKSALLETTWATVFRYLRPSPSVPAENMGGRVASRTNTDVRPWAVENCPNETAVAGVCACMEAKPGGQAVMREVSEEIPLHRCRHFIAAMQVTPEEVEGATIEAFYLRLGAILLGTVIDGNCAFDVACMMLGWPQTEANRTFLREDAGRTTI